jgi:hypothetical protein
MTNVFTNGLCIQWQQLVKPNALCEQVLAVHWVGSVTHETIDSLPHLVQLQFLEQV